MAQSLNPGTKGERQAERADYGNAVKDAIKPDAIKQPHRAGFRSDATQKAFERDARKVELRETRQILEKDKRPHCKTRPSGGRRGGGSGSKPFVPWC